MRSWGNIFKIGRVKNLSWFLDDGAKLLDEVCIFGNKRSYGDQAILSEGDQICSKQLDHFISFNPVSGIVKAQSGVLLSRILEITVPKGWFLPVTPGTKFITLGGAVANNVHGKNHHNAGSFGNFIKAIGLYRSDLGNLVLSQNENRDLYEATIGGSGLTGLITWVEFQLQKVNSEHLEVQNVRFSSLKEFFELSAGSKDWEYTVAWVDCISTNSSLGRGVFSRANFCKSKFLEMDKNVQPKITISKHFPSFFLNKYFIKLFNGMYYYKPSSQSLKKVHYDSFFYPLDKIASWNNLYGANGFYQFQCIIPYESAMSVMHKLLEKIADSKQGSLLAVLKVHADETSPGLNNFCMNGCSLALDFKNTGNKTFELLKSLECMVLDAGGRIYLAKDSTMSSENFKKMYPNWKILKDLKDPKLTSAQWKRLS